MNMVKAEFENIAKHKILTATVCAMMIIPFLYSVFFLKSVWDPYGNTGHLPVAVVNKDQSVKFQSKNFAVGDQLVDQLKENDDLDWHFVSAKKAQYGLSHKKYYMVITIPENFSKNATTVLNKKPKKMELTYKTNDSLNYIGEVISKQGATQVNASVKESVSEAYADTMFKVIKKVGGGFKTAANGAKKLSDGSKTLSDGLNTYTAGVDTVNKGVMTLNAGVVPLGSGVLQLTTGSSTLKNGIDTYTAGVDTVNGGVQTLKGSVPALTSGVGQLYTGSNALTSGLNKLKSNSKALNDGAVQLSSGLKKADDELKVLSTKEAQEQLQQVNSYLKQLPGLANEADSLLSDQNISGLQTLLQAGNTLGKINLNGQQLQQLSSSIDALKDPNLQNAINSLTPEQINQLKTQINGINGLLGQYSTIESSIVGLHNTIIPNIKLNNQQLTIEQIQTGLQNKSLAVALMNGTATVTSDSAFGAAVNTVLQETRSGKIPQANFVDVMGATLQAQGAVLAKQANYFKPIQAVLGNTQLDANSIAQIKNQLSMVSLLLDKANDVKVLMNTANQIDSSLTQSDIQTLLAAKSVMENQDFKNQTAKLNAVLSNKNEISAFKKQLKVLGNQATVDGLSNQLNEVPGMVSQLHKGYVGSNDLVAGIGKYTAGVGSAAYGSQQINAGLGQLNGKVPALASGVNQLASGTSQLAANSGALRSGAGQLAAGLGQLNSQVPTLTDGVSQLAAGTSKLAANSGKLDKGATDVHKGNKKLASALKGGADTVTKLNLGSANASMFASPTKLKEKHYSYVPNYGYALAPYMLSVALFVGCLVFNLVYPIRRISTEDGSATEWFFSKVAIGALVATGNALVETVLMMVCGLHPDHPVQMIVNAVSFSFTSMFLIMFMAMAFGNPGRFISMILLVIQLGSCGGSFPIEITRGMNGFFQAINPYLPMTYSVYGFREALTSGLGANQVLHSVLIQLIFIAAFLILLYVTMRVIRPEQEFHEEMESEYPGN